MICFSVSWLTEAAESNTDRAWKISTFCYYKHAVIDGFGPCLVASFALLKCADILAAKPFFFFVKVLVSLSCREDISGVHEGVWTKLWWTDPEHVMGLHTFTIFWEVVLNIEIHQSSKNDKHSPVPASLIDQ